MSQQEQEQEQVKEAPVQQETKPETKPEPNLEAIALKAQLDAAQKQTQQLQAVVQKNPQILIPADQKEEMAELKTNDPDAYVSRLAGFMQEQTQSMQHQDSVVTTAQLKAQFEAQHNIQLTEDFVDSRVPHKLMRMLENKQISYATFLEESKKFLVPTAAVADPESMPPKDMVDMNTVGRSMDDESTGATNPLMDAL